MIGGIDTIPKVPELRRRLGFTILMLALYRVGVAIPTPGIRAEVIREFFQRSQGTLFGLLNLFSGGALERFSVFALGIMPYVTASIILQLLAVVFPYLERLQKEGELGQRKLTQYTRYGTVILSLFQGLGTSFWLQGIQGPGGELAVVNPGVGFHLLTVLTLTAGTSLVMWLGEETTERGIGNGISLVIFAGIVARVPSALSSTWELVRTGELNPLLLVAVGALMVAVIGVIIYMEQAQRRIPVQYARRVVGRRMYGGQSTHLPLKLNTSGVIPPIFASSLLMFPLTIYTYAQSYVDRSPWLKGIFEDLQRGSLLYNALYVLLILFFTYFYTAVIFNPVDVADNLRKFGGYIPGIRPGSKTAEYIDRVLSRITLWGGVYVAAVCVLPTVLMNQLNIPFYFGGTALLIVVGVALDTAQSIESHLLMRHYEGFMKSGRLHGRRGG